MDVLELLRVMLFAAVVCSLVAICVVDLRRRIIPTELLGALVALWLGVVALMLVDQGLTRALLFVQEGVMAFMLMGGFLLAASLVYEKARRQPSLGGGDIKLLAVLGLYLGISRCLVALLLACLFALPFACKRGQATFAFGPAISVAALCCLGGTPLWPW